MFRNWEPRHFLWALVFVLLAITEIADNVMGGNLQRECSTAYTACVTAKQTDCKRVMETCLNRSTW